MIDTIAATAAVGDTTTIIGHRRVTKFQRIPVVNKKGGAGKLLLFSLSVSSRKRANSTYVSRATRTAKAVCSVLVQL
jgi:hypothetical protein